MPSRKDIAHFSGSFDAESREAFRAKREKHGLSRNALAKLLGVEGITIMRWECGPTVKVTDMARNIIDTFLSGGIDQRLNGTAVSERRLRVPKPMLRRIESLASVYALCEEFPEMQSEMVNAINGIVDGLKDRAQSELNWRHDNG